MNRSRTAFAAALLCLASVIAGCRPPLPEAGSPGAQLYVERCGQCHTPYNPHGMTRAMWDMQVTMMDVKIHAARLPPLTADEREAILAYLEHNAGNQ
jgi:mono/diheme cytochrome c family protein